VQGRCLSYGEGITYFPVVDVVGQLEAVPADPAVAATIGALLGENDAPSSPEEIAWAFRKLLEQEAPLVVVFDDIQWGEETFLDLVEQVAFLSAGLALLVICLARPELGAHRPGWPVSLRLEPLPPADVQELVPAGLAAGLRERIARAAGGNPLFLTEMVAMAGESGERVLVPATLKALLAARLDQLEPAERGVLERGAVEGELFHRGAVQALSPDRSLVAPNLVTLVRRELIRPERPLLPAEDGFRFCHLLIRDAAYDTLPKATRAELHERFAGWLDEHGGAFAERDELVGYHFEQAHHYRIELGHADDATRALGDRAATRLAASAERAQERGDSRGAVNLLQRALAVGLAEPRQRAYHQLELSRLLSLLGRLAESDALRAEATDTATRLGDPALTARVRLREAWELRNDPESDLEEVRRIIEDAIEALAELGDQRGLARADGIQAWICVREGHWADALGHQERALAAAEAVGWRQRRRTASSSIARGLVRGPTPVGEAIRRCEELILRDPSDRVLRAHITGRRSALVAMSGRAEEALELAERLGRELDELISVIPSLANRDALAEAKEYAGDRAAAIEEREAQCEKLEEIYSRRRPASAMSEVYKLALLYADEGRWEDAERRLAYGSEPPVLDHFREEAVLGLAARARVAAHHHRHDEAVRLATRALELAGQSDMLNLRGRISEACAEVHSAGGRETEANAAVTAALELYEQKGNVAAMAQLRERALST
jgi:hypothetical protein